MKNRWMILAAAILTTGVLSGCGQETAVLSEMDTEKYVTLGEYKGISVSVSPAEVTQEDVSDNIAQRLISSTDPVEVTDRPVQKWDTVNIDYEGKRDGVAFAGGTAQGYDLIIGSGRFIAGFEDGLIGATIGETRDLTLNFPDPYPSNPDLAGVEVVFTVKVNSIGGVAELTDELAALLDPTCSSAAEYEQKVLDELTADAQAYYEDELENAIVEQIIANATFKKDPPEEMVNQYLERIRSNLQTAANYYGLSLNDLLLIQYGITESQFEDEARPGAVESAQESILLQAIANAEGLNPTEEEIQQAMEEQAAIFGYASVEDFRENGLRDETTFRDSLMVQKVLDFIKEQAVIE